jgi:hypothetical protein
MSSITPEDVNKFTKPTKGFLCDLSDNTYGIEFVAFTIKDYDTKRKIFEVSRDDAPSPSLAQLGPDFDLDQLRRIDYNFEANVLALPRIATILRFTVGDKPVRNFRMIERHYFNDGLIKSFDFTFPFCIPKSTNEWESEYELPPMNSELVDDIVKKPFGVESDSFYFVDGKLIMHNKARYRYYYTKAMEAKLGIAPEEGKAPESKVSGAGAGAGTKAATKASKVATKLAMKGATKKRK